MIFEKEYKEMMDICHLIQTNKDEPAKKLVEKMILDKVDINTTNESLLSHIIATSLLKRIDRELLENKNIYLQKFDIPQIVLFYKMAEAYPQVSESHNIANQYIESVLKNMNEATIFDIGIGKGRQMDLLLNNVSKNKKNRTKNINIIGLDPDQINLDDCENLFNSLNKKLDVVIKYFPVCKLLEDFGGSDYEFIKKISNGNLIINSAYTMHHIVHPFNDNNRRTEILKQLEKLKPVLFTLIEPNSDHDIENLTKRVQNCWQHFGTVFQCVDESKINKEHKFLIKDTFFGREIRDIFGNSDYLRSERHESSESWMLRLTKANFIPYEFKNIVINLPVYCEHRITEGFVQLGYKSLPLVGIFAYKA